MTPQSKREYLSQLVAEKNRWSRPLTDEEKALGFLGWHERGYLPHCDFPGLVQFVTFRLADSMPAARRGEWEHLLAIEDVREKRAKLEDYLDRGVGSCHLRDPRIAGLVEEALKHCHNRSGEVLAWCVMPNHVHVLVQVWQTPLWKLVQGWKRFVAWRAIPLLAERRIPFRREGEAVEAPERSSEIQDAPEQSSTLQDTPKRSSALRGGFWQREYWDTFMRDEEQERKAVRYIEGNPAKARLCRAPDDWAFSSTRFRDAYGRLGFGCESGCTAQKATGG